MWYAIDEMINYMERENMNNWFHFCRIKNIYLYFGRKVLVVRDFILHILIYFSAAKENVKEMATKNKTDSDDDSIKGNNALYIKGIYIINMLLLIWSVSICQCNGIFQHNFHQL